MGVDGLTFFLLFFFVFLNNYHFNYVCTSPSFTILGVSCTVSGTRNGCTHLINLFLIPLSFSDVFFFSLLPSAIHTTHEYNPGFYCTAISFYQIHSIWLNRSCDT